MRMPRQFIKNESGETLVSFAITSLILFGFVFGLMEVCLGYYNYECISELAREGSRYAIVHGTTCETSAGSSCEMTAAQVQTFINGIGLPHLGGGTMTPTVTYAASGSSSFSATGSETPGSSVKVLVTYTFPYKIPCLVTMPCTSSTNLTMTSTSVMTILM